MQTPTPDEAIAATRKWLERAVIGLNLCPFAKAVHVKNLVRYVVSAAEESEALLSGVEHELQYLAEVPPELTDSTLLILPHVLVRFEDFTDFLDLVDAVVRAQGLAGTLQVASFHPDYCFSDAEAGDREIIQTVPPIRRCTCFARQVSIAPSRPSRMRRVFTNAISRR